MATALSGVRVRLTPPVRPARFKGVAVAPRLDCVLFVLVRSWREALTKRLETGVFEWR